MSKTITFEGKRHSFPDDASEEEIRATLSNLAPGAGTAAAAGAEGISETPIADRPIRLLPWLPPDSESNVDLPSPIGMAEMLPGAAGTVAGAATRNPLAVAGATGAGEVARQAIRKLFGYAPATGNIQQMTGMDPEGLPAAATGVAAEAATGGFGQWLSGLAAAKAPGLREKSLNTFASIFDPESEMARTKLVERIRPIGNDLPMGTRASLNRQATGKVKTSGEAVRKVYDSPAPSSFQPTADSLAVLKKAQVTTPEHIRWHMDPKTGILEPTVVRADVSDRPLFNAALSREGKNRAAESKAKSFAISRDEDPGLAPTVKEVFERRTKVSHMLDRATQRAYKPGVQTSVLTPAQQALKTERGALSNTLHTNPEVGAAGELADSISSAWQTVSKGTAGNDPSGTLARWVSTRLIRNPILAPIVGVAATKRGLWTSVGSKGMLYLANLIEAGDETGAAQLFNTFVNDYEQSGTRIEP